MIWYLLKFVICSAIIIGVYHIFFEREKIYGFNRLYLVSGILFSLVAPLIKLPVLTPAPVIPEVHFLGQQIGTTVNTEAVANAHASTISLISILLVLYLIVAIFLLLRFARNLYSLLRKTKKYPLTHYRGATLVFITETVTPHSFLRYIFINENDFYSGRLEPEVLQHELAHARQRHSYDILLMEILQALLWFNPFIFLYRKALQLNHEFLADEEVVKRSKDVRHYQRILIGRASQPAVHRISSHFNFLTTKKRIVMMTTIKSRRRALLKQVSLIPVLAAMLFIFADKVSAQKSDTATTFGAVPRLQQGHGISPASMNTFHAILNNNITTDAVKKRKFIHLSDGQMDSLAHIYSMMSKEQQAAQRVIIKPESQLSKFSPTQHQLNLWANNTSYGIWINKKRVNNQILNHYKSIDFDHFFVSNLSKNARENDGFNVQVDLMTKSYYAAYLKDFLSQKHYVLYIKPDLSK